jgi:hypothetical protein
MPSDPVWFVLLLGVVAVLAGALLHAYADSPAPSWIVGRASFVYGFVDGWASCSGVAAAACRRSRSNSSSHEELVDLAFAVQHGATP